MVSGFAEVNHNYEREHRLNLWFVVTAESRARVSAVLAEIEHRSGLPVEPRPYAALGQRIGLSEDAVIAAIGSLIVRGVIRRFGVIVRHRALGIRANGMVVWDLPDEEIGRLGPTRGVPRLSVHARAVPSDPGGTAARSARAGGDLEPDPALHSDLQALLFAIGRQGLPRRAFHRGGLPGDGRPQGLPRAGADPLRRRTAIAAGHLRDLGARQSDGLLRRALDQRHPDRRDPDRPRGGGRLRLRRHQHRRPARDP